MCGFVIPPRLLFGLGLLSTDGWVQIVPKCPPPEKYMLMNIPKSFASNMLPPQQATVSTCFPRRSSKNFRQVQPRFLWSLCFAMGPSAHESLCEPFKNGVSVSPSPMELRCTLAFNARFSRGPFSQCQIPRRGDLMWNSELLLLYVSLCDTVTFQSVGFPTREAWGCLDCVITPPTF